MILSAPAAYAKKRRRKLAKPVPARIIVRRSPLGGSRGILQLGALRLPCALGKGAISARKREGDGATPLAVMAVLCGYFNPSHARPWPAPLPFTAARKDLGWCDEPGNANYNRPVRLPFSGSCETMIRADRLYDICIVLDWNIRQRRRNAGSAIFLHVAASGYRPTRGCIALSPRDMARVLPHLDTTATVTVMP